MTFCLKPIWRRSYDSLGVRYPPQQPSPLPLSASSNGTKPVRRHTTEAARICWIMALLNRTRARSFPKKALTYTQHTPCREWLAARREFMRDALICSPFSPPKRARGAAPPWRFSSPAIAGLLILVDPFTLAAGEAEVAYWKHLLSFFGSQITAISFIIRSINVIFA